MGKTSSAVKDKWKAANYDRISTYVKKGFKEKVTAHAQSRGESVSGFVARAIDEAMERDRSVEEDKNGSV